MPGLHGIAYRLPASKPELCAAVLSSVGILVSVTMMKHSVKGNLRTARFILAYNSKL